MDGNNHLCFIGNLAFDICRIHVDCNGVHIGKNELCDYLCDRVIEAADSYALGKPWSRVIWDVTAIAWLLNKDSRFMRDMLIPAPIPEYDQNYGEDITRHLIKYVYKIWRDTLFTDLYKKLADFGK